MDKKLNTNNGKKGGTLEGPSHDNGGIKVIITDDNRPVEVEGGEVIINKHAAKKHWKKLSEINQSAGNGVAIHEPHFKKGGNAQPIEQPTEEEIEARWDKKKNSIQELANNIQSLRNNVTRDLSNEDEKTALTALVVSIMDSTAERVGNEDSADNGHFGVTGFQKKHIKVEGNKITLKYVGKSGVEHDTTFTDEKIANALKKAIANTPSKFVFRTSDDFQIKADRVNRYLSDFNVTAKDIRGYSANKWIIQKLKEVTPEQEETKRKTQFNKILSSVAEKIGHGKATLKKHYLVPELSETFISEGKIIDIKKLGGDIYKKGGDLIKRADGTYSKRGLWDNIRDNKGSGKKPTKEMLEQSEKIKSKYLDGGDLKEIIELEKHGSFRDKLNFVKKHPELLLKTGGELKKGIKVESEHIGTARKLFRREITPEQAAESIAREHIKEDPKYYTKLSTIEKHGRGANINPKKFKGLEKALSEFEDLDILSYISDSSVSQTFLFFCKFKRKRKYGSQYGLFIYNEYAQRFVEEPATLDDYDLTLDKLNNKYPALRVSKLTKQKFAQGSNINSNLEYKIGDTIRFNYGRADERKVLVGVVSDFLSNDKGYVVSSGFSQIGVDEKDVLGLEEVKETKKRFLFFEQGGVADFDISDYYELTFAGGGAIEKAKQIITQKIGLSEENADYIISMNPKIAIWLADSIVTNEAKNYGINSTTRVDGVDYEIKTINDAKKLVVKKFNESPRYIRNNFASGIRSIIDWISHPLTPNQNLKQLSFQEALDKSHIFHEELKVLGGDIDYKEPEENGILKEYSETDGVKYYWVYIPSNFCNIESSRMGHCGRTGYGNTLISLRSIKPYGKGHTISDSHVTIAYNPNEGLFYQTKGKKNQKPAEKYRFYIYDLISMMANDELNLPIANENTGLVDEEPLTFNGFGAEYDSKEDYGFEDMSDTEIKSLYETKPEIFNNFEGKILLYDLGLSTEKPSTSFILYKPAKSVEDLLSYNSYRNFSKDFIYSIIIGDYFESGDNWSYYYEEGWVYGVDDLNKENEQRIIDEIIRITNHSKEEVIRNGIKYYLNGDDEQFDDSYFDNIKRSIVNALATAERDDYYNYYYNQIKDALSELGVVKKLNDEGAEIGIDLSNFVTNAQIGQYMRTLESEDLEDVFFELEANGDLQLPELYIDDRYTAYADSELFNQIFEDSDLEQGYKTGGSITPAQKRKVAKTMHEWKAGRLHSGSKKGPIVTDQKQAVAIALSQADLSKYARGTNVKEKIAKNESEWYSFIREDLRNYNAQGHEDDRMSLNDYIGETGAIYGFKPVRDRRTFEYSLVRLANNPLPLKNFSRMTESNLFNEYYKQAYLNDDYDESNYNALMSEIEKRNLQDKFDQKAAEKGYYKTGGNFDKETYDKWKSLVNMTYSELNKFYESEEGKEAGLSSKEADDLGIKSGRESAKWIMKMKQTNVSDWTPKMWEWAKRQISFISRMSGNKGSLYDDKGNKTRKHTSLLIWGNNPEKASRGLSVDKNNNEELNEIKKQIEFAEMMFNSSKTSSEKNEWKKILDLLSILTTKESVIEKELPKEDKAELNKAVESIKQFLIDIGESKYINYYTQSAEAIRDFNLEDDTLIKARYNEYKNSLKKIAEKIKDKYVGWRTQQTEEVNRALSANNYYLRDLLSYNKFDVIGRVPKDLNDFIIKTKSFAGTQKQIAEYIITNFSNVLPLFVKLEKMKSNIGVRKVLTEEEKEEKRIKDLEEKLYRDMPNINRDILTKLLDDLKEDFKPLEKIAYKRYMDDYTRYVNEAIENKKVSVDYRDDLLLSVLKTGKYFSEKELRYTTSEGEKIYRDSYYYEVLDKYENWKKILQEAISKFVQKLKSQFLSSVMDRFVKMTPPIKSYKKVYMREGNKGFEGLYTFQLKDGDSFGFQTQCVPAGGYNIQQFHYRYLTDFVDVKNAKGQKTTTWEIIEKYNKKNK